MNRYQILPISMKLFIVGLVALVAVTGPSSLQAAEEVKTLAETSIWQKLMDAGEIAFKLGKYDEAENQFSLAACTEQNTNANDLHIATSLMRQADACCKEERFATADRLYKRALEIREKKLGMNHADVVEVLLKQAWLEGRHRNYAVEEQLYKRVLDIQERAFGSDSLKVAATLTNIGHCEARLGKDREPQTDNAQMNPNYAEAERFLNRALKIYEKSGTTENPDVAKVFDAFGEMNWQLHEFAKAEQYFRRALAIRDRTLSANDPSIEANLKELINLSTRQEKDAQAKPWMKRLIAIWKAEPTVAAVSLDPLNEAIRLNNRGVLCINMNELDEAESYFNQALRVKPDYQLAIENLRIVRNRSKDLTRH